VTLGTRAQGTDALANQRVPLHITGSACPSSEPLLEASAMVNLPLTVVDSSAIPWEERPNERIGRPLFRKELFIDPDTGIEVRLVRYPAGVINPQHTHPCAHGMFVLEGMLVTHAGQFGPGSFVWFPEGQVMEHGAGPAADAVVIFITNKPFRIDYC
jgi:quercetin dioxygenase-like cupin family protein